MIALRTENDILRDFNKIDYLVETNNDKEMVLIAEKYFTLKIDKKSRSYETTYKGTPFSTTLYEHKLLNELFEIWRWI